MKIKEGYLLREVANNYVVVPTGKAALDFSGMISLNETGAFLWKELLEEKTEEQLLASLLSEYEIDVMNGKLDIQEFVTKLKVADLLE